MHTRRRGSVAQIVCLVVIVLVLGGLLALALLTESGKQHPVRTNSEQAGKALELGLAHMIPGHRDGVQVRLLTDLERGYRAWGRHVAKRLGDLEKIQKNDSSVPAEQASPPKQDYGFARARRDLEFRRAALYLEYALNGLKPIDEVKKGDNKPLIEIIAGGGDQLVEAYNKSTSAIVSIQQWNPATGDPPGLEFQQEVIANHLRGIDLAAAGLDELRNDPKLKDAFADAAAKKSARLTLLQLLEAECKALGVEKVGAELAEVRKRLADVNGKFEKFCSDYGSKIRGQGGRDPNAVAADIALCRVEAEAAGVLADMAAKVREVEIAKSRKQFELAMEAVLLGRKATRDGKEVRLGGLSPLVGVEGSTLADVLDKTLPRDKVFSRSPADDERKQILGKLFDPDLSKGDKATEHDKFKSVLRAPAAVALQTLFFIAGREAIDADLAVTPLREKLIAQIEAVGPKMRAYSDAVAKHKRDLLPLGEATVNRDGKPSVEKGGTAVALERLRKTLDSGELDGSGQPVMGADGQPRPGLTAALAAAKETQTKLKQELAALYDRSDALDKEEAARREELAKEAERLEKMLQDFVAAGPKADAAPIIGNLKNPEERGEIGVAQDLLRKHIEEITRTRAPYWYEEYFQRIERQLKVEAGERPEPPTAPPARPLAFDGEPAAVIKELYRLTVAEQDEEIAGLDAPKAKKIADMDAKARNAVLANATALTLQKFLGLLDAGDRGKVISEMDQLGVEKLIAHYESRLVFAAPTEAPDPKKAWNKPSLDDRKKALEDPKTVFRDVPVLEGKIAAVEAAKTSIETIEREQRATADASGQVVPTALKELREAVLAVLETSAELSKVEAEAAQKYEEAILRFAPAAAFAAERTERGWHRTTTALERGNTMLLAAAFYLQQHRRLAVVAATVEAVKKLPAAEGLGEVWSDSAAAIREESLKPRLEKAVAHAAVVRKILDYKPGPPKIDPAAIDLLTFEPASGAASGTVQPVPLVRVFGVEGAAAPPPSPTGEAAPAPAGAQASLIAEAVQAFASAQLAWKPEAEPAPLPSPPAKPGTTEPEYFRVKGDYVDAHRWPIDVSEGVAYALAHRVLADKTLAPAWAPALKTDDLRSAYGGQNAPATADQMALAFLRRGLADNLTKAQPEMRLKVLSGLDNQDPVYYTGNNVGDLILYRIGFNDSFRRFNGAMSGAPAVP